MTDRIYNVLFLCTGNTARSILAEIDHAKGRPRALPLLLGRKPAQGAGQSIRAQSSCQRQLSDRRDAIEELGGIRRARRAGDGFRFHRLRQRRRRKLSGVARSTDDRALGHRGSGPVEGTDIQKEAAFVAPSAT